MFAPRALGFFLVAAAAFFFWRSMKAKGDPMRWLPIMLTVTTIGSAIGIFLQPKGNHARAERLVRVRPDRRVIVFHHTPIAVNFFQTTIIEHYECPIDDLRAYELFDVQGKASLRLWTPRGHIAVSANHDPRIHHLHAAIHDLAGDRPPPLANRGWLIPLIAVLIGLAVVVAYAVLTK